MESSAVLRMLSPPFLITTSSVKPSNRNLGSSAVVRMFPKSVSMVNAREIPKSVSKLEAWKRPTKREHPLLLSAEDIENDISVAIDSGSDEGSDEDDYEVIDRNNNGTKLAEYIISLRQAGLPLDRYAVKEDDDALHLKLDLPGLLKEKVRVNIVKDIFIIRVVNPMNKKTRHIREASGFTIDKYKVKETKAEMKNGLLKIVIPKIEGEERKDEIVVKVA